MKDTIIRIIEEEKKVSDFFVIKQISISNREDGKYIGPTLNIQKIRDESGEESIRFIASEDKKYHPYENIRIPVEQKELVKIALSIM